MGFAILGLLWEQWSRLRPERYGGAEQLRLRLL